MNEQQAVLTAAAVISLVLASEVVGGSWKRGEWVVFADGALFTLNVLFWLIGLFLY